MNQYEKALLKIQVFNCQQEQEIYHQDTELLYVLEGTVDVKIGEQSTVLQKEDVLVINFNKSYRIHSSPDALFVKLSLPYHYLSSQLQTSYVIFWCDSTREQGTSYEELRRILKALLKRFLNLPRGNQDFGTMALSYQVLDLLSTHFRPQLIQPNSSDKEELFHERMVQINSYIHANYNQPISSKDLADRLYLSQGYLSRFFKKNYGMSFAEYLSRIRLYYAVDDLLYTNLPITRIAYDNGFVNVAAFTKAFREHYGETPSAMRKKQRETQSTSVSASDNRDAEKRLEQLLSTEGISEKTSETSLHLREFCSVRSWTPLNPSWGNTINMGAAADLLNSQVQDHVVELANSLKFRYVRFWNLFSPELLIVSDRQPEVYNFSKLDAVLDFLLEHHLKPHMELGMKPRRLYRNVQDALYEGPLNADGWSPEKMRGILQAMMRHLQTRYPHRELNSWRMEYWFPENRWGQEHAAQEYFQKFQSIYQTVKEFADGILVGGCGLRLGYTEGALDFLKQWSQQPCRPDFLSVLYYPYLRGEVNQDRYSRRSTDQEGLLHALESSQRMMTEAGLEQLPLFVTEWNLTVSDRNYINDSCFKGAYILKNMLECCDKAQEFCYFLGSDRVSEYFDSLGLLHGGTGLLSKDNIMKPAAYAFHFLSCLYPNCVSRGSHFMITTDGHGSYGIVLHNQKSLNSNYYLTQEDELQRDQIWNYFEDREPLHLELELGDLSNGTYRVKTYQVTEKIGSPLYAWQEMEFENELSRRDVEYLQRVSGPKLTIRTQEVTENQLSLDITLSPNEIRFIRIRKIL